MKESVVFAVHYQINRNHVTELPTIGQVISERHCKSTFNFTEIENKYVLKRGTIMSNCENTFTAWS